jgi:hypothetical protein
MASIPPPDICTKTTPFSTRSHRVKVDRRRWRWNGRTRDDPVLPLDSHPTLIAEFEHGPRAVPETPRLCLKCNRSNPERPLFRGTTPSQPSPLRWRNGRQRQLPPRLLLPSVPFAFAFQTPQSFREACPMTMACTSQERSSTPVKTAAVPVSLKCRLGCRTNRAEVLPAKLSDQLLHRLAVVRNQVLRAARQVRDRLPVHIDP